MHAILLSALIATTPAPSSPSSSDLAAALAPPASPSVARAAAAPSFSGLALPVILLAGMAGLGMVLLRRRGRVAHFVQVLETASLGPRRSLVVARLGNEVLLLGASEAGIHLLSSQPASPEVHAAGDAVAAAVDPLPAPVPLAESSGLGILGRLRRRTAPPPFDSLLTESLEDQELRRKLAHGLTGSVR